MFLSVVGEQRIQCQLDRLIPHSTLIVRNTLPIETNPTWLKLNQPEWDVTMNMGLLNENLKKIHEQTGVQEKLQITFILKD